MKCLYHFDADAHGLCNKCNKAICSDCMFEPYDDTLCPKCAKQELYHNIQIKETWLKKYRNRLIFGSILGSPILLGVTQEPSLFFIFFLLAFWVFCIPIAVFLKYDAIPNFYVPTTEEAYTKQVMNKFFIICIVAPFVFLFSISDYLKIKRYLKDEQEFLKAFKNINFSK